MAHLVHSRQAEIVVLRRATCRHRFGGDETAVERGLGGARPGQREKTLAEKALVGLDVGLEVHVEGGVAAPAQGALHAELVRAARPPVVDGGVGAAQGEGDV